MIVLDDAEIKYLIQYLQQNKPKFPIPHFWCHDSITKKLFAEDAHKQSQVLCDHKFAEYEGSKVCCSKCEAIEKGMGFSWTFKNFINEDLK